MQEKDYHPGSDGKVVNVVHPSLFCLVYGHSTDKSGKVIECPEYAKDSPFSSRTYQWLPSEFLVDEHGSTTIASYINSLPVDSGLYAIVSELFSLVIPLFERVLGEVRDHAATNRILWPEGWYWWHGDVPAYPPEGLEDEESEEYMEWENKQVPTPVPIEKFSAEKSRVKSANRISLKGLQLQVIVKIGYVELTPEKPEFDGGNWHVEVRYLDQFKYPEF